MYLRKETLTLGRKGSNAWTRKRADTRLPVSNSGRDPKVPPSYPYPYPNPKVRPQLSAPGSLATNPNPNPNPTRPSTISTYPRLVLPLRLRRA